ncbi:FMN-binding protein [Streptomyces sp. NPDC056161]|uniref:FMN-binding protein n=1 Tax=Streptomyces sp. NPDC056161 TaxID=3345732 RepID=UPI0035E29A87
MAVRRTAVLTASTVAGIVLLLGLKPHQSTLPAIAGSGGSTAVAPPVSGSGSSRPSPSSNSRGSKGGKRSSGGGGATGTYAGAVMQTPYGPMQVEATFSHGRMTGVRALQTPNDSGRSQSIAASSVPTLTREALAAQSAQIQAVSGASYTSEGYMQSLQSALDKAGA